MTDEEYIDWIVRFLTVPDKPKLAVWAMEPEYCIKD